MIVPLDIATNECVFDLGVSVSGSVELGMATGIQIVSGEKYTGETMVTPTANAQVLHTAGLVVDSDITINPIPNNYGLITWDGSLLTVS